VSSELSRKIQVGLEEFATVRQQFDSLLSIPPGADPSVIEISAACAMLHSFYTEIEKILKIIAREWDGSLPESESWHRDLLVQMSRGNIQTSRSAFSGFARNFERVFGFPPPFPRGFYRPHALGQTVSTGH
jgi:hypothetical protein